MKKYVKSSEEFDWESIQAELASEADEDIDSFAEFTDAGNKVLNLCYAVEEELGLDPDVSMSNVVYIYDEDGESITVDYYDFNSNIFDCAMSANSPEEFKNLYKNYLSGLVS